MDVNTDLPLTVDALIARLEAARAAFDASLAGLTPAQLAAPLTERDWSVIDHMAHLATWMEGILAALAGTSRWAAMGAAVPYESSNFDAQNEQLRALHAAKSPAEVQAWLATTHARMIERLRGMTMAELRRPYRHYQPDEARADADQPFLRWVAGDTYEHYDEHRGWIVAALQARGWA